MEERLELVSSFSPTGDQPRAIQDLVDDPSVKNYAFDTMVKGAIPVLVGVHVTMEYVQGITPPEEADVQQAVADAINAKSIGAEYLSTAEVVVTANEAFPDGEVKMPVNLFGRIFMPNGTQSYATDQNYLMVQASAGISYRNCCFFCYPDNVDVSLVEVSG